MKNIFTKITLLSSSVLFAASAFADTTATATATWKATAEKDTKSALVVTPSEPVKFLYDENLKAFTNQEGVFDITIQGQSGASDFELTSQLIQNTLTRGDDASTLDVGVSWNGSPLTKTSPTTLINVADNISAGLDGLIQNNAYSGSERSSARGKFVFNIEKATDGTGDVEYSTLPDGVWNGEVAVQFTAHWTTP